MPFGKHKICQLLEPMSRGPEGFILRLDLRKVAKLVLKHEYGPNSSQNLDSARSVESLLKDRLNVLKFCYEVDGQSRVDRTETVLDLHQGFGF